MCLTAFKAVMDLGRGEGEEEESKKERKLIRRLPPTDPDKWKSLPQVPNHTEMGYLHLSFEYHRGALRVRVWQISDLLLPPPQISMIHSIFVRGYFLPDKVKKTQRKTEEVIVEVPDKSGVDGAGTGLQHIFTPSSFKFCTPLQYTGMTTAIIRERSLQLEVCLTQKNTYKVYLMAMVHMPLRTALRRPIREKYPLIPCVNLTTPNSMRVYSATCLPHLANPAQLQSGERGSRPNGLSETEAELEDPVPLSGEDFLRSHLSLCLDADSEDEEGTARPGGQRMTASQASSGVGSGASSSSTNTLNNPSSEDEGDHHQDDNDNDDDNGEEEEEEEGEEERSLQGEGGAGNTPLDRSVSNASDVSAWKKKIIPNELLKEGDEVQVHTAEGESRAVDRTADTAAEEEAKDSPASSPSHTADSPVARNSQPPNGSSPPSTLKPSPDVNSAVTPNTARKRIIPDTDLAIPKITVEGGEECIHRDSQPSSDPSSTQEKKDAVVIEQQVPTKALSSKTGPDSSQPVKQRADSDSLTALSQPSSLSPMTDSGFCPASRPETPCWDFYDFSEDLQPEGDLELSSQCLEDSLNQLRQQGMGSLHNVSLEPILPMVLVDDFDTLAVEDE